jgi:hypothetical protein
MNYWREKLSEITGNEWFKNTWPLAMAIFLGILWVGDLFWKFVGLTIILFVLLIGSYILRVFHLIELIYKHNKIKQITKQIIIDYYQYIDENVGYLVAEKLAGKTHAFTVKIDIQDLRKCHVLNKDLTKTVKKIRAELTKQGYKLNAMTDWMKVEHSDKFASIDITIEDIEKYC